MIPNADRSGSTVLRAVACTLCAVALALWLPALSTPWWGDDYYFLTVARAARLGGESWWTPYWPDAPVGFWRPLGHDAYWRFVEGALGADARAAHVSNLVLWAIGCAAVGLFGAVLARASSWDRPALAGALSAGVYAVCAMHFTPVHWISSDDSLFVVAWTALALAAWTAAPSSTPRVRALLCALLPVLQVLALLSKESGVLVPLLALCVAAFAWERSRPGRPEAIAWLACAALVAGWVILRSRLTLAPGPAYEMAVGVNVLRNLGSLLAWSLNVPREALRMIVVGDAATGAIWALAAAAAMSVFVWLAARGLAGQLRPRQLAAAAAFALLAYGPYYFLATQSYEYYAQVAMILPAILLARGLRLSARPWVAVAALSLSSFVAVEGSRAVEYPGLVARARWAERELAELAGQEVEPPLRVRISNPHQFAAIGAEGLAWRLGLRVADVEFVDRCPDGNGRLLAQRDDGLRWVDCTDDDAPAGTTPAAARR